MEYRELPETSSVTMIDFASLLTEDDLTVAKLVQAMEYPGYFYLDFRNASAMAEVAEQARAIYDIADDYFEQPTEAKAMYIRDMQPEWSDRGYKACDTDESFEISTDEMNSGSLELPDTMNNQVQLLISFQGYCHKATKVILSQLADTLNLPALMDHHSEDKPSESGLKLIAEPSVRYKDEVLENKHRDSGTLTMLFYETWSMHICLSNDNDQQQDWVFVPPPPKGCALVHGANSLARLSSGKLRSPLHRVTQPSDGAGKRYFLSYFLRPEHRLREEWSTVDTSVAAMV